MMRVPPQTSRRAAVGVITTTGGGATMVVDPLSMRGVNIVQPSAETLARFQAAHDLLRDRAEADDRKARPPGPIRRHDRCGQAGVRGSAVPIMLSRVTRAASWASV